MATIRGFAFARRPEANVYLPPAVLSRPPGTVDQLSPMTLSSPPAMTLLVVVIFIVRNVNKRETTVMGLLRDSHLMVLGFKPVLEQSVKTLESMQESYMSHARRERERDAEHLGILKEHTTHEADRVIKHLKNDD